MPSVLALISKAVFDKLPGMKAVGEVVPLDRYTSKHAAFDKLGPGDAIFLVTVRPKGPVLVAILDAPKRKGDALVGETNTTPLAFITDQIGKLQLADGKGITATLDKLGMSLQTPRVLADADVSLLRGKAPKGTPPKPATKVAKQPAVQMKVAKQPAVQMKVAKKSAAEYAKLKGGELSARAMQLLEDVYRAPDDRGLREVLADQLLQDQHVWGELISLQLAHPKKHAERIEAIIRQHAREVVGEIANVASREDLEIVDGFLVHARCGKSKSFTSAAQRDQAAKARQWFTVRSVMFTTDMTGTFYEALFANPASANLTKISFDSLRKVTLLSRAEAGDPWQIANNDWTLPRVLDALPAAELARIPPPRQPTALAALEKARARRAPTKPKKKR